MAHELSHHWFGDLVTCDSASEMWLNEGWARYNEKLFLDVMDASHKKVAASCRYIAATQWGIVTQIDMDEYEMLKLDLHYFTMCRYDDSYKNVSVLFEKENLTHTLGEVIAQRGLTQLRIAETEKYPHVSFFFSGGREAPFEGETRIIIPSAKVATYDLQPEMSAQAITKAAVDFIDKNSPHLVVLNFANTDMVGHTGVFAAAVVAAQTVDNCLAQLVPHLLAQNYQIVIIADHGNADVMLNPDGSPNTAHSTNPVPLIYINPSIAKTNIQNGKLADIAPTILSLMGIDIPPAMTGEVIIYNGY